MADRPAIPAVERPEMNAASETLPDKRSHGMPAWVVINPSTNYQSGVDWHLDWGASQFVSKQVFFGAVGYFYEQISPDSGSGDHVGPFELGVIGVGPQMGVIHVHLCQIRQAFIELPDELIPRRLSHGAFPLGLLVMELFRHNPIMGPKTEIA